MSEKLYKIGEAAQALNLKSYVLRFWESEFPQLRPTRTESGQRLYTEQNLELLKRIRHLLHERGLTIEGARKIISDPQYAPGEGLSSDLLGEGLSSDLLDEGYKDFIADLDQDDDHYAAPRAGGSGELGARGGPGEFGARSGAGADGPNAAPASSENPDGAAGARTAAALEARNALLADVLAELKSVRALFPEAAKSNLR